MIKIGGSALNQSNDHLSIHFFNSSWLFFLNKKICIFLFSTTKSASFIKQIKFNPFVLRARDTFDFLKFLKQNKEPSELRIFSGELSFHLKLLTSGEEECFNGQLFISSDLLLPPSVSMSSNDVVIWTRYLIPHYIFTFSQMCKPGVYPRCHRGHYTSQQYWRDIPYIDIHHENVTVNFKYIVELQIF